MTGHLVFPFEIQMSAKVTRVYNTFHISDPLQDSATEQYLGSVQIRMQIADNQAIVGLSPPVSLRDGYSEIQGAKPRTNPWLGGQGEGEDVKSWFNGVDETHRALLSPSPWTKTVVLPDAYEETRPC